MRMLEGSGNIVASDEIAVPDGVEHVEDLMFKSIRGTQRSRLMSRSSTIISCGAHS